MTSFKKREIIKASKNHSMETPLIIIMVINLMQTE